MKDFAGFNSAKENIELINSLLEENEL